MNNEMNPIETNVDDERDFIAALSDEQFVDTMHTMPSENKGATYCSDADIMITIAKSVMNDLIPEKADRSNAERTQAEAQTQIEETFSSTCCNSAKMPQPTVSKHPLPGS